MTDKHDGGDPDQMNSAPKPHVGPLPTCTIDDVLSWDPCDDGDKDYSDRAVLVDLAKGKTSASALDILAMRHIPAADRLWLVLRPALVPEYTLHVFATKCADRALRREKRKGRAVDLRSRAAIKAKLRWLRNEIDNDQLGAARAAAWAAAGSAALDAAWTAAWTAARDAARTAARTAAVDGAWDAAWAAAGSVAVDVAVAAARDAEHRHQIQMLAKLLRKIPAEAAA